MKIPTRVSRLIAELKAILAAEGDIRVIVSGYEDGFDDPGPVAVIDVALNVNRQDYYGKHERVSSAFNRRFPDAPHERAVLIPR
jgi:hypothetical protein